ncbi:EF-hand domain-containing protein [uncultured Roseovarius sp.]|uniref:EF-hand domain-containing protein n=1 Tax=uncultured Roseovarius sp. TaxID=293344 RepID=UPI000C4070FF|nr:calcium-binding protein [Roseovarius sp.]|tara:strand:+ start:295 stop:786 length:492 start_codon:yes stop_codon:yes gene_type:complete
MNKTVLMLGLTTAILAGGLSVAQADSHMGKMGKGMGMHHSFEELDADADGKITPEEMSAHMQARFEGADTDGDGALSKDELIARMTERQAERMAAYADHMIERHDANKDGKLSPDEMKARNKGKMFEMMDADADGAISKEEFTEMRGNHGQHHGMMKDKKASE